MPREPRPKNKVGLRLEISTEYHERMFFAAAKTKQSLAAYARRVVMESIDRDWPQVKPRETEPTPSKAKKRKGKSE